MYSARAEDWYCIYRFAKGRTVLAQRHAVRQLREVARQNSEPLQGLLLKLERAGQAGALVQNLRQVLLLERAG